MSCLRFEEKPSLGRERIPISSLFILLFGAVVTKRTKRKPRYRLEVLV